MCINDRNLVALSEPVKSWPYLDPPCHRLHEVTVTGFRQMLGDDHPDTLRSMNHLGEVLWELGVR
jgi:hypothetical protein